MAMAQVSPNMPLMLHFLWIRQDCDFGEAEEGHREHISSEVLTLAAGNCVCPHLGNLLIGSCFPRKAGLLGAGATSSLGLCGHRAGVWASLPRKPPPSGGAHPKPWLRRGEMSPHVSLNDPMLSPVPPADTSPMTLTTPNPSELSLSSLEPDQDPFRCGAPLGLALLPHPESPVPSAAHSSTAGWGPCPCCPHSGRTSQSQSGLSSWEKWPDQVRGDGNLQ